MNPTAPPAPDSGFEIESSELTQSLENEPAGESVAEEVPEGGTWNAQDSSEEDRSSAFQDN